MANNILEPRHEHHTLEFPKKFLWGAATSAFQVEGNVTNSDWWEWEQKNQPVDKRSGLTCNQYNLYEADFDLAKSLGHNSHRLSIEWSRIEPVENEFNNHEIEHYQQVLKALKDRGFTVILTLHHFSNPAWFAHLGGWENSKTPFYFDRFVKTVVPKLSEWVDLWITINEPGVYASAAYYSGDFPPQKRSKASVVKVFWQMAQAHKRAYQTIHRLVPKAKVGIAQNASSFHNFHKHSLLEDLTGWALDITSNHTFYMLSGKTHDFLGLNYYTNKYISFNGEKQLPDLFDDPTSKQDVSDLGWEVIPEGIFDVIMDYTDYHLPIYITENGIASTNDDRRVRFLLSYLKEVYHAIASGAKVQGYFYWSLLDNMELNKGYDPRFGLVQVDFKTQARTPRPSSYVYREIINNNGIPHFLLKLLGHGIQVEEVLGEKSNLEGAALNTV